MVEANKLTLQFYRQACRLIPALVNRTGNDAVLDYHKSKLNLGMWIRKGANMRNPSEVTEAIRVAYDFLFACAYGDFEAGYFNRYLVDSPQNYDTSRFATIDRSRGLNLLDQNRFKGKSSFMKKFIKGTRPLMH